jgi:hypothetical protein
MQIVATVHTTQNLGDRAQPMTVAVEIEEGETVSDFVARVFSIVAPAEWEGCRFNRLSDHIELRIAYPARIRTQPKEQR